MLRKAYQALEDFDNRYAEAVQDFVAGPVEAEGPIALARKGVGTVVGNPLRPYDFEFTGKEGLKDVLIGRSIQGLGPVGGFTARYALPGAGITAAGAGLVELADAIGQQTNSTLDV